MTDQQHPHHRFPTITWPALLAELERELTHRRRVYPGQVEKAAMAQSEMDWQIRLAEAWLADAARFRDAFARFVNPLQLLPAEGHPIRWQDRRAALTRELTLRRRLYPRHVEKGTATQADADRRIELLACLLALYEEGFDFPGTTADFAPWYTEITTARQPAATEELFA